MISINGRKLYVTDMAITRHLIKFGNVYGSRLYFIKLFMYEIVFCIVGVFYFCIFDLLLLLLLSLSLL